MGTRLCRGLLKEGWQLGAPGGGSGSHSQQGPFVKLLESSLATLRTESPGFEDLVWSTCRSRGTFCSVWIPFPSLRLCPQLSFNTVSCRRHGGP